MKVHPPGADSGEILEVGKDVKNYKQGDNVMAHTLGLAYGSAYGVFQLYVRAKTATVPKIPDDLDFRAAVVLPLSISTAAAGLYLKMTLGLKYPDVVNRLADRMLSLEMRDGSEHVAETTTKKIDVLLVWGVSSSVGSTTIQLAVASGYDVVTTASPRKYSYCKDLGACLVLDYHAPNIVPRFISLLHENGTPVAGAYDAIGTDATVRQCAAVLHAVGGGTVASVVATPDDLPEGVKAARISSTDVVSQDDGVVARKIWGEYVPAALPNEVLKATPREMIIGRRLRSIQAGLDRQKEGLWFPDPPGTINPARLSKHNVGGEPGKATDFSYVPTLSDALKAAQLAKQDVTASVAPLPPIPAPVFPLPRISSDRESDDFHASEKQRHEENRLEFEALYNKHRSPCSSRSRRTSHYGFSRTQIQQNGASINVPLDFRAGFDAKVVIDRLKMSIYDAYLVRVDITKNVNYFRRQQVVFNPETGTYALYVREGRVGLEGFARIVIESPTLSTVTARFRKFFQDKTLKTWNKRYEFVPRRPGRFAFVELDYTKTTARPKELPKYTAVDGNINAEVRGLMEHILFGGPVKNHVAGSEDPSTSAPWLSFTAPYEQLSSWTVFSALKILLRIRIHIESGNTINWMTILRLSSHYRSQIPFYSADDRPAVISSYHALFLEAKFLYCLWPFREIAKLAEQMHCKGSLQLHAHKVLAQPLYQAYSSLRHGFRRLTDASTPEFRQLKAYLENSCHRIHCLSVELEEIYRLFVKAPLPNPYRHWIETKKYNDPSGEMRLLLWHGTPVDSLLGILDVGLQIRRQGASWTGSMFGNAIYLADASSKSAGFCRFEAGDGHGILLLCEADVGVRRIRSQASIYNGHEVIRQSRGRHRCIEGLGRTGPARWKPIEWQMEPGVGDGSPLMPEITAPYGDTHSGGALGFNEYAMYDPSHVMLRYLLRVKIKRRLYYYNDDASQSLGYGMKYAGLRTGSETAHPGVGFSRTAENRRTTSFREETDFKHGLGTCRFN
ncbi:hypothetical protein AYL99_00175 [Fonsecaea erecta]|uniref:Poly [ADP-ribose] polymerase n=1 Tax=Fonsecaea erecta TaxID=1367422 RepID=A0A178ZY91_9EURO|nr:hypothetical protein AYL99_00175 [Fonsecaea erecta]OAP64203.1 hypothetical protein AYL99_00175 [Fonsecaea erecta]